MNIFGKHFILEEAVLWTDRTPSPTEYVLLTLSDMEIFEHIDKPCLSANFTFTDTKNILDNIDFQGSERLRITLKPADEATGVGITKVFILDRLVRVEKLNDKVDQVFVHGIEDIDFYANVQNINKVMTGTPASIVSKIASEYLKKDMLVTDGDAQRMKVIVPNLDPLDAMCWIKNRATNKDGLPYYLYSCWGDNYLRFFDLGTIMTRTPVNSKPFTYTMGYGSVNPYDTSSEDFGIKKLIYENNEDLYSIIRAGSVGSKNNFINTMFGNYIQSNFSVDKDTFNKLADNNYFVSGQNRYSFGPASKVFDRNLSDYKSRVNSYVTNTGSYWTDKGYYKSYSEEQTEGDHKLKLVSKSIKEFIGKNTLTIQLDGRVFTQQPDKKDDENCYTVGNVIKILVFESNPDEDAEVRIDRKKSGNYIVFKARHMMSVGSYFVNLTCGKLASLEADTVTLDG